MYSDVRAGVTAVAQKAQELGLKGTIANTLEQTSKALSNTWDTIKNTPNALWNALAKIPVQVKEDVYRSDGVHDPTNLENSFAFGQTPTGSLMGDMVAGIFAKAFSTGGKAKGVARQIPVDNNRFAIPHLPGAAQSRITVAKKTYDNGHTRGFDYAMGKHGMDSIKPDKSYFSIPDNEVKILLQRPDIVKTQVYNPIYNGGVVDTGKFVRQLDVGKNIGINQHGKKTSLLTIITDKKGNLINTFPGPLKPK